MGCMSNYYNAFEMSPVPVPGADAVAPEPFRGSTGCLRSRRSRRRIWPHPSTSGLAAWTFSSYSAFRGSQHLRRWAFQDVLLVPAASVPEKVPAVSFSFACVLNQIESIADACRALNAGAINGPRDTPWGTRDVEVITPERVRIIFTAAKPLDPASQVARNLAAIGITAPDSGVEKNGERA